jgi:hypothetical protein
MQHVDQSAGGNQLFTSGFPGRPISRVLFPIGKRRFIAPVRQLLHGFSMRRSRHKRSDRLIVPPHRQRPERKPARLSHFDTEIARGPFRLPDRSPGVPEKPRKKADRAQVESGDGDDCHSLKCRTIVSVAPDRQTQTRCSKSLAYQTGNPGEDVKITNQANGIKNCCE